MATLALQGLTKRFGDDVALHPTDLTIGDREFFVFVGPSGSGKTTLLGMIAGLEEASGGRIIVDGDDVTTLDSRRRDMAMVFQSYALYPHMTVFDNLAFPLRMGGRPEAEIEPRVREVAEMLAITELLPRRPASLSGGQRQRVAMGRALVRQPRIFLLDEPLSNLDARLRLRMRGEVARLQQRLGVTTLYVTHDQGEAMTLGDRIAVLHEGRVQQVGTPRELYEQPANLFVAGFIGEPAMNLLSAGALPLPAWAVAKEGMIAGIRPEHLQPVAETEARLTMRVQRIEWLGAEWHLHGLSVGESEEELVVRLAAASDVAEGDLLPLTFRDTHLHLFAPDDGQRLVAP